MIWFLQDLDHTLVFVYSLYRNTPYSYDYMHYTELLLAVDIDVLSCSLITQIGPCLSGML